MGHNRKSILRPNLRPIIPRFLELQYHENWYIYHNIGNNEISREHAGWNDFYSRLFQGQAQSDALYQDHTRVKSTIAGHKAFVYQSSNSRQVFSLRRAEKGDNQYYF